MTLKEYVEKMKGLWIGLKVYYQNKPYTVVDVDCNGMLLIDRPTEHTTTTAIAPHQLD